MITKDQIKLSDGHAGVTASGTPVIYVLSKGGLHMFLTKRAGQIEALAAAPHIGIARFFAEKKAGGINWGPDYIMKSEDLDKVQLYHGTNTTFDKFKLPKNKESSTLNYGKALYFTDDKDVANSYAKPQVLSSHSVGGKAFNEILDDPQHRQQSDQTAKKYGLKHSRDYENPKYKKVKDQHLTPIDDRYLFEKVGGNPHVRLEDVDIKNPFNVHNQEHAKKVAEVAGHPNAFNDKIWRNSKKDPYATDFYNLIADGETLGWNEKTRNSDFWKDKPRNNWGDKTAVVNDLIRRAGFDSIHNAQHKHYAVFSPKQIKKNPDIKFGKSENDFLEIRKSFFNGEIMADEETYAIYDHKAKVIDIMDKEDFEDTLKKGDITPFSFVRRIDIESVVKLIGTTHGN